MYKVEYQKFGDITLANVFESHTVSVTTDNELSNDVLGYLREYPQSHVLLNFADIEYISSARLSDLLRINEEVRRQGGSLRICGLSVEVKKVFAMTKLDTVLQIDDDPHLKNCIKRYHKKVHVSRKASSEPQ